MTHGTRLDRTAYAYGGMQRAWERVRLGACLAGHGAVLGPSQLWERHLIDVCKADAPVLVVLGHPCETPVIIRQVEVVHLWLPLPPVFPQVPALQERHPVARGLRA